MLVAPLLLHNVIIFDYELRWEIKIRFRCENLFAVPKFILPVVEGLQLLHHE